MGALCDAQRAGGACMAPASLSWALARLAQEGRAAGADDFKGASTPGPRIVLRLKPSLFSGHGLCGPPATEAGAPAGCGGAESPVAISPAPSPRCSGGAGVQWAEDLERWGGGVHAPRHAVLQPAKSCLRRGTSSSALLDAPPPAAAAAAAAAAPDSPAHSAGGRPEPLQQHAAGLDNAVAAGAPDSPSRKRSRLAAFAG